MELSRIACKYVDVTLTATLRSGVAATLAAVDVALLPYDASPTASTAWTSATYADGVATFLVAGPDASAAGALAVPALGADVWVRVTDTPEVDAVMVGRIGIT